jgi:hypothetical protein
VFIAFKLCLCIYVSNDLPPIVIVVSIKALLLTGVVEVTELDYFN